MTGGDEKYSFLFRTPRVPTGKPMTPNKPQSQPEQPEIRLTRTDAYRDSYANSVQVKMSVWDFQLIFGTCSRTRPTTSTL